MPKHDIIDNRSEKQVYHINGITTVAAVIAVFTAS